jgi:oxalate decarboxylase
MDYEKKDLRENKFAFESSEPLKFTGGTLHRATKKKFPALQGLAIQALHLNARAVREPHVHPNAHQLDYVFQARPELV